MCIPESEAKAPNEYGAVTDVKNGVVLDRVEEVLQNRATYLV
jgi:hypothetical protein